MMTLIKDILKEEAKGQDVVVKGWVKTKRETKNIVFLQLNDGSCFTSIQIAFERNNESYEEVLKKVTTGCSCEVTGSLNPSPAEGQSVEVLARSIKIYGEADPKDYPLQKKNHSFEFLRENAHLRARTNTFAAVARVRSRISYSIHTFFQKNSFQYVHTPIITASDCEGAGEMFQVTTLNLEEIVKSAIKSGVSENNFSLDYSKDFFGKRANLTVSGQMEGETYATALSRIYTFAPTFRAENSNTTRHLAEFWMVEPEMAFFHLKDNADLAESFIKYLLDDALTYCAEDLKFFDARIKPGLIEMLNKTLNAPFGRITYTEAIKELEKHKDKFEYKPSWGVDLQSEHERFLTEEVFKCPLIVTDYPKGIKAFYMKLNDDEKTVRAMDVLVPGLGEIIGGSEREDSYDILLQRIKECGLKMEDYWWYIDLRKYGSVPHSGFGLGLERCVAYITGMSNIRDVIPYPRFPKGADF
ncbi:MAG: asparagine--tRNA ligase [Treponema sp.]